VFPVSRFLNIIKMIFMLHRVEGSGMLLEFKKWNDMLSLCKIQFLVA
jgi:hypothetical protein